MTAKERRKVKHALKTSVDMADIWLKIANDARGNLDPKDISDNSKQTIISELKQAKKEISEYSNAFISEIDDTLSLLK